MDRKMKLVALLAMLTLTGASVYALQVFTTSHGTNCPSIFATVSFQSNKGFVTTAYPSVQSTEFVLLPNSVGQITVSYSSSSNNLTTSQFSFPVPAWKVNLTSGSLTTSTDLNVTVTGIVLVNTHQVTANYTVSSKSSQGLYVLGLPSTCLSSLVNVGSQAYTGPWPISTNLVH